jgi:iron complex transport system substrate-binding protein
VERVERVRRAVTGVPAAERPRVFYQVWDRPLMTAGPESFVGELIETAGGRNVFADVGSLYPRVSPEAVIRRDPDVILAPDHHGEPVSAEMLAARPGWEAIRAVRRRRVHTIDGDLVSRPGPRLVQGLEIIARLLHPERLAPGPAPEEDRS